MYAAYLDCIRRNLALPHERWFFKRDPAYRAILEHVTPEQGEQYLEAIRQDAPMEWPVAQELINRTADENDAWGGVRERIAYPGVTCAPSNLRYFHHALLIWRHVHRLGIERPHFVEIGGGYGGLALYLHRMAHLFSAGIQGYTILDLPEAMELQGRYAAAVGLGQRLGGPSVGQRLYCISAYAFSEFDKETRDWYARAVVRDCPHGWMLWNGEAHPDFAGPVYPFTEAPLAVEDERPLTCPGNKVVTW